MFRGENLSHFSLRNMLIWVLMSFQAGAINAGGFIACSRFVTHTTGFATLFGTELARGELTAGIGILSVPCYFLLGAMLSAFLVDRRRIQGQQPLYSAVMGLVCLILFTVVVAGNLGFFGVFNHPMVMARDYAFLALLCFVSGLQNAMVTSASGAVVRTTHLTGLTTDLGIGLVRVISQTRVLSREDEIRAVWMRLGIIGSFILGSTAGAFVFFTQQYWGFLLPALVASVLWVMTMKRFRVQTAAATEGSQA
ncbi:MAG: DUF1275 domain-containing protein [Bdellovibrionaceae bacterium]|nr:DUF1275 domain-containing protein [Pseudobdellovibrionaceae bacterium]MBX3033884.1 DUF1275 domain-containing protein [Pseudobdellovibrionaceae bacterium]